MGLDQKTIDEIMRLKKLYDKADSNQPLDAEYLREELNAIKNQIEADVEAEQAIDHLEHDAKELEKLSDMLPSTGMTTSDQN